MRAADTSRQSSQSSLSSMTWPTALGEGSTDWAGQGRWLYCTGVPEVYLNERTDYSIVYSLAEVGLLNLMMSVLDEQPAVENKNLIALGTTSAFTASHYVGML